MASDDLAVAHLRRFSIPLPSDATSGKRTPTETLLPQVPPPHTPPPLDTPPPYISSPTEKRRFFNDDSQNDDSATHDPARRHRRKKKEKKRKIVGDHVTEPDRSNSDGGGMTMCDTSDNYTGTEGEGSTYREVSMEESGDVEDGEVPHRRLKMNDNVYVGSRRRSSNNSIRRSLKQKKQRPVVSGTPDQQDGENTEKHAEPSEGNMDDTDPVYQGDVSRTYESLSEYVLQSDEVLLDTKCVTNAFNKSRCKNNDLEKTAEFTTCEDDQNTARLKLALRIHLGFRSCGMLTHGLVAGIAISQCIFVFSFSSAGDGNRKEGNTTSLAVEAARVLLGNYSKVAVLFQSLYYFFLSVSIVSILDRFINIDSDWTHLLQFLIAKPLRACALIAYFLSFIFSVSLAELDDIISMYTARRDVTTAHQADTWKVLNMFRVVTAVVGWVSVAFSRHDDVTCVTLENVLNGLRKGEQGKYLTGDYKEHSSPVRTTQVNDEKIPSRLEHAKM